MDRQAAERGACPLVSRQLDLEAGVIALWPGVVAVAARVGVTRPGWAVWGGSLVVFGLFARAFHLWSAARPSRNAVRRMIPLVVLFAVGSIVLGQLG